MNKKTTTDSRLHYTIRFAGKVVRKNLLDFLYSTGIYPLYSSLLLVVLGYSTYLCYARLPLALTLFLLRNIFLSLASCSLIFSIHA